MQTANKSVGTSAVAVAPGTTPPDAVGSGGVMTLICPAANSGNCWVGFSSGVTAGGTDAHPIPKFDFTTAGVPAYFVIPASHFERGGVVYVIGDASSQHVYATWG